MAPASAGAFAVPAPATVPDVITAALYTATTGAPAPDDLEAQVAAVVVALEGVLHRPLVSQERTEWVNAYDGCCWPKATPITDATGLEHTDVEVRVGGNGVERVQLTYTGGYDVTTCPRPLAEAICWGVHTLVTPPPAVASGLELDGVTSLSVAGEFSVSRQGGVVYGADGKVVPASMGAAAHLGGRCLTAAAGFRRIAVGV